MRYIVYKLTNLPTLISLSPQSARAGEISLLWFLDLWSKQSSKASGVGEELGGLGKL